MTRRHRTRSTRNRILGWYLVLLAVALVAALLLQRQYLFSTVDESVTADLIQETGEFTQSYNATLAANPDIPGPDVAKLAFEDFLLSHIGSPGEGIATYGLDDQPFQASDALGSALHDGTDLQEQISGIVDTQMGEVVTSRGVARYIALPLRATEAETQQEYTAGVFVVGVLLNERFEGVDQAFRTGALMVLLVFVLVSAIAWLLAGRILRPLRDLTSTAAEISDTDLSRRIPVGGKDELARLATTFNAMLDRLEGAFTTQRRFIDDAGHELRTPITIIRGHLELLGDDPQEREQTIEIVTTELDRMARIVDDLLVLARSEQPDFVVPGPMDVEDFVNDLIAKAWAISPGRNWKVDESIPAVFQGDAQRLTQAMVNLIRNVGVHTPPGTPAAIGAAVTPEGLSLWVRDTGPGIPDENLESLFERFRRGSTTRRTVTGAGLGLSIVAAIAEAHGGEVRVETGPEGSRFVLQLPYAAEADMAELAFA